MLILYAVMLSVVIGYIKGGSFSSLLQKPFKLNWLVFTAIFIQLVLFSKSISLMVKLPEVSIIVLHLISYILIIGFIIVNIKISGIGIIGAGIVLNFLAIFLNNGYMPTSVQNFKGIQQSGETLNNTVLAGESTLVPWLGDIFHTPQWLPLSNAFSIGDVLIAVGVFIYMLKYMKSLEDEV